MNMLQLIVNSFILGLGLAMDAFSICVANTMDDKYNNRVKMFIIPLVFGFFQFIMPLIGYSFANVLSRNISIINESIHIIAFLLLSYIGIKMIYESIVNKKKETDNISDDSNVKLIIVQGLITSVDALSAGFAFSNYNLYYAIIASIIIGIVTFIMCVIGANIGHKVGSILADNAKIYGGIILILIGIKIFLGH